jgi:uncharacterized protein
VGAYLASAISGNVLRIAFAINIAAVVADSVLRKRFVEGQNSIGIRPLSTPTEVVVGIIIGAVASLLGVGGSVMTVPLMWRRGAHMRSAVALADLLSFPVVIVGTLTHVLAAEANSVWLGGGT